MQACRKSGLGYHESACTTNNEVGDIYRWESVNGRVRGRHSQARRLGMGMLASSRLWLQLDAAE